MPGGVGSDAARVLGVALRADPSPHVGGMEEMGCRRPPALPQDALNGRIAGDIDFPPNQPNPRSQVWELRTKKLAMDLPGHADEVYTVDWSPDGASVASGGKDRILKLWRQ